MKENRSSRRRFLKACSALACSLAGGRLALGQETEPYGPFAMGVQSYCFRKFTLDEALSKTRDLGLKFIEVYPGHFKSDSPPDVVEGVRKGLASVGVRINAYGVCGFTKDHEKNKALFSFAKQMGIGNLSADPAPDSFDSLEKLVEEFQINIAIHNHGPKSRYSTLEDILKVLAGRSERIGVCVDTGHFVRSDVSPIEAVRKLAGRVHGVHLKDTKEKADIVVGKGDLDLAGFLRALKDARFSGYLSLEYESDPDNPMPAMQECLAAVREAVKKLA